MSTPRAVICLEIPAITSVRIETVTDVDALDQPQSVLVIRTEGESYFLSMDPTDLPKIGRAIAEYPEGTQA